MNKASVFAKMTFGRWYTCKDFGVTDQKEVWEISSHLSKLYKETKLDRQNIVRQPGYIGGKTFEYKVRDITPLSDTIKINSKLTAKVAAACIPKVRVPEPEPVPTLSSMEEAMHYLGLILQRQVESLVEDKIAAMLESLYFKGPSIEQPFRSKLKTIIIAGLLPGQGNTIKQEFGRKFNLEFIEGDSKNPKRLAAAAKGADHVLLITGKVGHHHQDQVRHHPGLIWVNGLMTEIRTRLTDLV